MKSPAENKAFIRFVQLACTDPDIGSFVESISAASAEERNKLLTQTAAAMRQRHEPEELAQVVEWLREPKVLEKLLELIRQEGKK